LAVEAVPKNRLRFENELPAKSAETNRGLY
jgi:hypothetical protein